MSRNKEHRGAAFGGAPNGAAMYIYIYIYLKIKIKNIIQIKISKKKEKRKIKKNIIEYFPYIFLCMVRNLFSQQLRIMNSLGKTYDFVT